jgi:hypothetical protein
VNRPKIGSVEERTAPDLLTAEDRKIRGLVPYGVESRDMGGWREVIQPGALDAALGAAGLGHLRTKHDPMVWHDLRHTFGTTCAAKGIDLRRIQAWMGHADIQTTMRYLHYVPQHDDAARLTAAFSAEAVHPDVHRTTVTTA